MGRRDSAGHPIGHYATVRGDVKVEPKGGTTTKSSKPYKPHENAQKDPFKFYGESIPTGGK